MAVFQLSDMYYEMSQKSRDNEDMTRKSMDLVNATSRTLLDGIHGLKTFWKHSDVADGEIFVY